MRGRVPDLMNQIGISERELIDKHLRRQLTVKRTISVQKDGKSAAKYTVDDSQTQIRALHLAFPLHGSYAPRNQKEAAQLGVKVIVMDVRGPSRPPIDIKPGMAVPERPTHANAFPD